MRVDAHSAMSVYVLRATWRLHLSDVISEIPSLSATNPGLPTLARLLMSFCYSSRLCLYARLFQTTRRDCDLRAAIYHGHFRGGWTVQTRLLVHSVSYLLAGCCFVLQLNSSLPIRRC